MVRSAALEAMRVAILVVICLAYAAAVEDVKGVGKLPAAGGLHDYVEGVTDVSAEYNKSAEALAAAHKNRTNQMNALYNAGHVPDSFPTKWFHDAQLECNNSTGNSTGGCSKSSAALSAAGLLAPPRNMSAVEKFDFSIMQATAKKEATKKASEAARKARTAAVAAKANQPKMPAADQAMANEANGKSMKKAQQEAAKAQQEAAKAKGKKEEESVLDNAIELIEITV